MERDKDDKKWERERGEDRKRNSGRKRGKKRGRRRIDSQEIRAKEENSKRKK